MRLGESVNYYYCTPPHYAIDRDSHLPLIDQGSHTLSTSRADYGRVRVEPCTNQPGNRSPGPDLANAFVVPLTMESVSLMIIFGCEYVPHMFIITIKCLIFLDFASL